jgi:hypothetical protein
MRIYFTLFFISFFALVSSAQQREVGLLDLSSRNAEANQSRIRSCRHILQVAGVPYEETTSLTQALAHPIVMFSPVVFSTTFNSAEKLQIQQYVNNGGVLIASSVRDPALYPLFGVSGFTTYTDLKRMTWHVDDAPQYFDRFDEGFEEVISLSDSTGPQAEPFNIRSYAATGAAQVLAHFDNNTNAVITHQTGAGRTFLFSLDLRDVIIRNLINSDLHAQRGFSNIFEPTTDTFIFFIMNVIREHMPNTVRAHTCPDCDGSVVMITHDVDSRTAMDTMQIFINYEEQNNLNAMYNITTRYFSDSWMTDFYNGSYDKVHYVLQHGQRIASHSVGHFPDYDDETRFPFTSLGNTPVNYQPRHFSSITTGGNVFGEVEVSKYLLENDHNVAVKSFRAGHLAFNQRLPKALEEVGYLYNSTFSANDVLTNFPFWDIDNMTFSGNQTSVLEIPMTISDASAANPFTEQNALSIAQGWIDVTLKNHNNNAPTVLLIHPNRGYKLPAQEMFVNGMPDNVKFMFLDDFGDYWKMRIHMQISSELVNDTLLVTWSNYIMNQGLSLVIDNVDQLSAVRFFDGSGNEMFPQSQVASYGETRYCQFVYDESFEVCNGIDDDGDGNIDENLAIAQYADTDQDGYGDPAVMINQCTLLPGYVTNNQDCNDQSTVVHPANSEYCDQLDNNCDGNIDEGFTWSTFYSDGDADGFGNEDATLSACLAPDNFVLQPGDCDDENPNINPNVQEVCNDIDDNCDLNIDEGLLLATYYEDLDQDGYGNDAVSVVKCVLPFGFVALHGDCTDSAPAINPGAAELCGDGWDNDCDGQIDEGCIIDNDEDGFDAVQDCDDENGLIFPGAAEVCNGFDDNCDGQTDENVTSASIASSLVNSAPFPTCTSSNIYSANFNIAVPANTLLDNEGVVIWYKLNAQYNAIRVGLSAAFGDNELRLYESLNGCLSLIETEHEATTGNQVLLSDQLNLGNDYYIAVRHLSGPINSSAKICVNHFVASTCDHVYSNNTGVYSSVCSSFKAQYRGNAAQYVFNVLENQPWSYTTTSSNSIVTRLGSILPVNVGQQPRTYSLSVDVKYSVPDVLGNYSSLTALSTSTCNVTLQPEGNVALRATDRCPATKALTQSIATDRAVCGTLRYEWKFTRTLPSSAPAIQVLGGMNTTVLFLNGVAGLTNNATYDVQVRAIHSSGVVGEWGSSQCMKIGAASGMILQPVTSNDQIVTGSKAIWTLYPNPSLDGNVTIASNGQEEMLHHLQLFDAMGRSVWKDSQVFGGSVSFNLPEVSHGMYTLSIDGERIRCVIGTE